MQGEKRCPCQHRGGDDQREQCEETSAPRICPGVRISPRRLASLAMPARLFFPFPAVHLAILPRCTGPRGSLSRFVTSPDNATLTALRADAVLDVRQCASTDMITAPVAAEADIYPDLVMHIYIYIYISYDYIGDKRGLRRSASAPTTTPIRPGRQSYRWHIHLRSAGTSVMSQRLHCEAKHTLMRNDVPFRLMKPYA